MRWQSARDLTRKIRHNGPGAFKYEYVFEWGIPTEYVVQEVCLGTLIDNGFDLDDYVEASDDGFPSTHELKDRLVEDIFYPFDDFYALGQTLGRLARCFGRRAPWYQIALQLFYDCTRMNEDAQIFQISCSVGSNWIEFWDSNDVAEGIESELLRCLDG